MTTTKLTVGQQDQGGGYYAPTGENNEIDETKIIYINDGEPIPGDYVQVPEAEKKYLAAWIFNLLRGPNKLEDHSFDHNGISALCDGPKEGPDNQKYQFYVEVTLANKCSKIYFAEFVFHDLINHSKDENDEDALIIKCNWDKLNAIVFKIKKLQPGKYRFVSNQNSYDFREISEGS